MAVFVLFVLAALVCVGLLGYICMGIVALIGVFKRDWVRQIVSRV